eukprot:IDg17545t1
MWQFLDGIKWRGALGTQQVRDGVLINLYVEVTTQYQEGRMLVCSKPREVRRALKALADPQERRGAVAQLTLAGATKCGRTRRESTHKKFGESRMSGRVRRSPVRRVFIEKACSCTQADACNTKLYFECSMSALVRRLFSGGYLYWLDLKCE